MPSERYFLEQDLVQSHVHTLEGAEYRHLAHTMRARRGDQIELVNGKGTLAKAVVHELLKNHATLKIEELTHAPLYSPRLILAQALPKNTRLDVILEKGTELGVDAFWLFPGALSLKKELSAHQLERMRAITIAAMKQCGRLTLPELIVKPPLHKWPTLDNMTLFFGDLSPQAPSLFTVWPSLRSPLFPLVFVTGPEAGLDLKEERVLRNQGAIGVKLHPYILRTDTASLAALSLLSHWALI